jgi:homoserine kinase type II
MAVYTEVPAEALQVFLARYDLGPLVMAKGIAEGVSNSNFLIETGAGRFILTLYERRIEAADIPFFLDLMTHLADAGLPVPRPVPDRRGVLLQTLQGKAAALIQFLPGVSVTEPSPDHARAAGTALARLHQAGASFARKRANALDVAASRRAAAHLGERLDALEPGLAARVATSLAQLGRDWPKGLPVGLIHADLFPDNVLFLGTEVSGLIDFYFAATDLLAYDLAVLAAAWAFTPDGRGYLSDHDAALMAGYESVRPLLPGERAALPLLGRAASLRFLMTRALDWFEGPGDALVNRKNPLAFARRLAHYAAA